MSEEIKNTTIEPTVVLVLLFIFGAALVITLPVWLFGIPNGNDFPQHYQFAITFFDSVKQGIYYPGWSPFTNYGYGDVGIRFYPPLAYYILIFFRGLLGNWYDASCIAIFLFFFLSGAGFYLWSNEWFSERASLFSAIIYMFAPYHLNQLYKSFLFAELAGSAILPFCFLFATKICRRGKLSDIIGLGVFYGLLILTHLPTLVIGSICLFIYCCFSIEKQTLRTLLRLVISVTIGLSAASFYWIRMIFELDYVAHSTSRFVSQEYDFHSHFIFSDLFYFLNIESKSFSSHIDLILIFTFAFFLPSLILYYLKTAKVAQTPKLYGPLSVLILSVFMTVPLSLPVWENFSFIQKIQFPWRWLPVVSLSGIIYISAFFEANLYNFKSKERYQSILAAGLLITGVVFACLQTMNPLIQYSRSEMATITERLREGGSYICWLPVWADRKALTQPNVVNAGDRAVEVVTVSPTQKLLRFQQGKDMAVRVNIFYYPHWRAYLDGNEVMLSPGEYGTINFNLPTHEAADVTLSFVDPPYVRWASIISILVFLTIASFLVFNKISSLRKLEGFLAIK